LYSLIFSSKLATAKAFKRWVTSEILPTIRKHGAYITDDKLDELLTNPASVTKLFNLLKAEREKKDALLDYVEAIAPKAQYYDLILKCENTIPVSVIAKDYGMTAVSFNKLLNGLGVQYSVGGTWLLYKKYCNNGYTITRTYHVNETTADVRTYWTQKGRHFLYVILKWYGVLPEAEKGGVLCRT
jgi:phage antirepressor YoqD-like protein